MLRDDALARLGARQHGVVDRGQALACGFDDVALCRRVRAGRLLQAHPGVYVLPGAPETWHQRLLAGCRAAGSNAVASHRSAARLWALVEDDDTLEVSVPRSKGPRPGGVVVHRSRDLVRGHTTVRQGIPVTNPLRTIVDLGAVLSRWLVEDALDRGLAARLFSVAAVEWLLHEVARPGRRGCGVLRQVLDERALGTAPPDGLLEPRMARLLRSYGLPPAAFQLVVPEARARVDFAYPDVRLAIEVDGYATHGSPRAMAADFERQNRLAAAGWSVVRFTWSDVVRRPSVVAATLTGLLGG